MWQQRALANQAIDVSASLIQPDFRNTYTSPDADQSVHLQEAPPTLRVLCVQGLDTNRSQYNVVPYYSTRSIGIHTGRGETPSIAQDRRELELAETIPSCEGCGLFMLVLHGPFGSVRWKKSTPVLNRLPSSSQVVLRNLGESPVRLYERRSSLPKRVSQTRSTMSSHFIYKRNGPL